MPSQSSAPTGFWGTALIGFPACGALLLHPVKTEQFHSRELAQLREPFQARSASVFPPPSRREIDPNNEIVETNEGNNRFALAPGTTQNHTFYKPQQIKVAYAPIHYTYSGWGGAQDPTARIHTVDWLRSLYPVPNYNARSVVYYPYPGFTFNKNVNVYDDDLIAMLNTRWMLSHWGLSWLGWLIGIDVGPDSSMLYVWLPDGAYGDNGLSDTNLARRTQPRRFWQ